MEFKPNYGMAMVGKVLGQEQNLQNTSGLTNCFRCRISTGLASNPVPVFPG